MLPRCGIGVFAQLCCCDLELRQIFDVIEGHEAQSGIAFRAVRIEWETAVCGLP